MGECSRTESHDHLSLRTQSTVFSLARTESPGATALPRRAWKSHRPAIILISTGGSMLLAGFVLSGLYFAEEYTKISAKENLYNTDQTINSTSTNQTSNSTSTSETINSTCTNQTTNSTSTNQTADAPDYCTSINVPQTNYMDSNTTTNQTMYNLICGTIVGPPLVSIGLMVMMVGVVLIPVTREIRQQNSMKRLFPYKTQNVNV